MNLDTALPVTHIRGFSLRILSIRLMACFILLASGCAPAASAQTSTGLPANPTPGENTFSTAPGQPDQTNPGPTEPAAGPQPGGATATAAPSPLALWLSPALPAAARRQMEAFPGADAAADREHASIRVEIPPAGQTAGEPPVVQSWWVYALAAPFPTLADEVSAETLQKAWNGTGPQLLGQPLLMTAETRAALEARWGPAAADQAQVLGEQDLLERSWSKNAIAIIPFEEIQPRWKILAVDGQSPLRSNFDPATYPLALPIQVTGQAAIFPPTNRDPQKLTVLTMTGVTALSRHIGERMESKGLTYPLEKIRGWLADSDLTHISNEVSFYEKCPKPGPDRADMRFCSSPRYIELLEEAGADIIELTGNHILDWGVQPFLSTLEMYHERGWAVYGGGATLNDALQPALVEHNGNRLAFLGCSPSGPAGVWARGDRGGSAPCDYPRLEETIARLREAGYLPVVTLQAVETDTYLPAVAQGMPDFRRLARAGAVIVSGSQSHVPQTMTFIENSFSTAFVHYGLGNLFFDQMKPEISRQEFIDRHTFYDGKYLGVELLTAKLEDYAQPRPMELGERRSFLEKIFSLCQWKE